MFVSGLANVNVELISHHDCKLGFSFAKRIAASNPICRFIEIVKSVAMTQGARVSGRLHYL